ncbi:UNKNOWN [Stylonychia lemnae]|uniref:Transmembrane protein 231 n=1 Tax=Stylonychia lemnae TaxID=5949 RepID=A0A077ZR56_STYLE|nr:UNKNOWN [Stylonychia lemnae]|eukprot:CDW72377.1 UNKNOWN [Stylonychia lemnae]
MAFNSRSHSLTLFTEYYQRKFIAHNRSWSNIFHILIITVVIILPFILTFQAGMFTDPATKISESYVYSTSSLINNQAQTLLNPPAISTSSQDFNRDGMAERWNISMKVRKPADNLLLSQVTVIAGFDYQTVGVVDMQMKSLAILQKSIPIYDTNPVSRIKAIGSLQLKQLYPLRRVRGIRSLYNDNLFGYLEGVPSQSYLDIDLVINIPTYQEILYIPNVWEILKFAWIQYYSFMIIIYVFLYHFFYGYVIKNKVYETSLNTGQQSKRQSLNAQITKLGQMHKNSSQNELQNSMQSHTVFNANFNGNGSTSHRESTASFNLMFHNSSIKNMNLPLQLSSAKHRESSSPMMNLVSLQDARNERKLSKNKLRQNYATSAERAQSPDQSVLYPKSQQKNNTSFQLQDLRLIREQVKIQKQNHILGVQRKSLTPTSGFEPTNLIDEKLNQINLIKGVSDNEHLYHHRQSPMMLHFNTTSMRSSQLNNTEQAKSGDYGNKIGDISPFTIGNLGEKNVASIRNSFQAIDMPTLRCTSSNGFDSQVEQLRRNNSRLSLNEQSSMQQKILSKQQSNLQLHQIDEISSQVNQIALPQSVKTNPMSLCSRLSSDHFRTAKNNDSSQLENSTYYQSSTYGLKQKQVKLLTSNIMAGVNQSVNKVNDMLRNKQKVITPKKTDIIPLVLSDLQKVNVHKKDEKSQRKSRTEGLKMVQSQRNSGVNKLDTLINKFAHNKRLSNKSPSGFSASTQELNQKNQVHNLSNNHTNSKNEINSTIEGNRYNIISNKSRNFEKQSHQKPQIKNMNSHPAKVTILIKDSIEEIQNNIDHNSSQSIYSSINQKSFKVDSFHQLQFQQKLGHMSSRSSQHRQKVQKLSLVGPSTSDKLDQKQVKSIERIKTSPQQLFFKRSPNSSQTRFSLLSNLSKTQKIIPNPQGVKSNNKNSNNVSLQNQSLEKFQNQIESHNKLKSNFNMPLSLSAIRNFMSKDIRKVASQERPQSLNSRTLQESKKANNNLPRQLNSSSSMSMFTGVNGNKNKHIDQQQQQIQSNKQTEKRFLSPLAKNMLQSIVSQVHQNEKQKRPFLKQSSKENENQHLAKRSSIQMIKKIPVNLQTNTNSTLNQQKTNNTTRETINKRQIVQPKKQRNNSRKRWTQKMAEKIKKEVDEKQKVIETSNQTTKVAILDENMNVIRHSFRNQIFDGSNLASLTPDSTQFFYENQTQFANGESRLGLTNMSNDHTVRITDESMGSSSMNDLTRQHQRLIKKKQVSQNSLLLNRNLARNSVLEIENILFQNGIISKRD